MIRRLAAVLAGVVAFAAAPAVAQAHPLGNFTVNRYSLVQIDKGSVRVTFVLDEAEIPTFQELGGQPTAAAARAWAEAHVPTFANKLHLTVNGTDGAARPRHERRHRHAARGAGRPALPARDRARSARAISGDGPFTATFSDDTFGNRVGWKEVVMRAAPGAVLTQSIGRDA